MTIPVPLLAAAYILGAFAVFPMACSMLGWSPGGVEDPSEARAMKVVGFIVSALWPVSIPMIGAVILVTIAVERAR